MKPFRMMVKDERHAEPWVEEVDYSDPQEHSRSYFRRWCQANRKDISDMTEEECGRAVVDMFNATLRPGEVKRTFVKIKEILDNQQ